MLKNVITKNDEGDLFNIANNFAIRHDNEEQKTSYDRALWLSWMFLFLSSYATLRRAQVAGIEDQQRRCAVGDPFIGTSQQRRLNRYQGMT
jgi:hypothetical protein